MLWASALALPWLIVPTWLVTHPIVHVDNASGGPIQLWVDGTAVSTVPAHDGHGVPPSVRLRIGSRHLGWSPVGSARPVREVWAEIQPFGHLLYNPGEAGCHWLTLTSYGSVSVHGHPHGPQALAEFQRFLEVDHWFTDPPAHVGVVPFREGAVHVTLQRWAACMELRARGCSTEVRRTFASCMRSLDRRTAPEDCWGDALRSCPATSGSAAAVGP